MPIVRFTKQSLFGRTRKDAGIIVTTLLDIVDANMVLTCNREVPKNLGMYGRVVAPASLQPNILTGASSTPVEVSILPSPRHSTASASVSVPTEIVYESNSSTAIADPMNKTMVVTESTHRWLRRIKKLCDAVCTSCASVSEYF